MQADKPKSEHFVLPNWKKKQVQKAQKCYHILLNNFVEFKKSTMLSWEHSQNNNFKEQKMEKKTTWG